MLIHVSQEKLCYGNYDSTFFNIFHNQTEQRVKKVGMIIEQATMRIYFGEKADLRKEINVTILRFTSLQIRSKQTNSMETKGNN